MDDETEFFKSKCCCDFDYDGVPIKPQKVMHEINKLIDDDAIVTTDVGQNQKWQTAQHQKTQADDLLEASVPWASVFRLR